MKNVKTFLITALIISSTIFGFTGCKPDADSSKYDMTIEITLTGTDESLVLYANYAADDNLARAVETTSYEMTLIYQDIQGLPGDLVKLIHVDDSINPYELHLGTDRNVIQFNTTSEEYYNYTSLSISEFKVNGKTFRSPQLA